MESTFATKARENIRAATMLFANGMYDASANRSYYAALQAAVSALANAGIRFERIEHAKVQARFSTELIRRKKVFPGRLRSHLMVMQGARNIADYGSTVISKKVTQRQLNRAKEYVGILLQEVRDVQ